MKIPRTGGQATQPRRHIHQPARDQHALLLGAMLVVTTIVSLLMAALRRQVRHSDGHAMRAEQLRAWGDTLRDAADPLLQAGALQSALASASAVPVALLLLKDRALATAVPTARSQDAPLDDEAALRLGETDADQAAASGFACTMPAATTRRAACGHAASPACRCCGATRCWCNKRSTT